MIDRLVREPERRRRTGLSRTQWWRLEAVDQVPRRRQISANSVGWLESELTDWISNRPVAGLEGRGYEAPEVIERPEAKRPEARR